MNQAVRKLGSHQERKSDHAIGGTRLQEHPGASVTWFVAGATACDYGLMFWFMWKTFAGSYFFLIETSRS